MLKKPDVFNYRKFVEALEEVERLRKQVANLEIKCRILEEGRQEWVTNDLPMKSGQYLVIRGRDAFGEEGMMAIALFDPIREKFYYPSSRVTYDISVLAWMPLPEPYVTKDSAGNLNLKASGEAVSKGGE